MSLERWNEALGDHARPGNRVDSLIDGWAALEAMAQAIRTTFSGDTSTHYVYFLGWWLDEELEMIAGDRSSTFAALTRRAADAGVQVRVVLWKNALKLKTSAAAQAKSMERPPNLRVLVDASKVHAFHSHHQKLLVVRGKEGLVGFCGGIDVAENRVRPVHLQPGSPYLDVHCRVAGPAARDLVDVFLQRWNALRVHDTSQPTDNLRGEGDAAARGSVEKAVGSQRVAIKRTFVDVARRCLKDASIRDAMLAAIRTARRFIYIEDQYLINRAAAEAIGRRLGELSRVVIVIPHSAISDLPRVWPERRAFVETILAHAPERARARLWVLFPYRPPTNRVPAQDFPGRRYEPSDFGPSTYVHSKTWVIDDELAVIGSANCNRRGWLLDSEVAAFIVDREPAPDGAGTPAFAQELRARLWARLLDTPQDYPRFLDERAGFRILTSSHARDYLRRYDPWEPLRPQQGDPDAGDWGFAPEFTIGATQNGALFDLLGDPPVEPLPECSRTRGS